ncbi:MAG: hypothetical protein PVF65_00180 [Sphingomonadales bacterium]|jgi:hypothetical protein
MRLDHNTAFDELDAIRAQTDALALLEMLESWSHIALKSSAIPRREDLSILEDSTRLKHVAVLDIIRGGADCRFRMMGRAAVVAMGMNPVGQCLSALPDSPLKRAYRSAFKHITHRVSPIYMGPTLFERRNGKGKLVEQLHLPLNVIDNCPFMIVSVISVVEQEIQVLRKSGSPCAA